MLPDGRFVVAIDFDGVINNYQGWKGIGVFEEPVPGTAQALSYMRKLNMVIIIHTTRGEANMIADYLNHHHIPFDHINRLPGQPDHQNLGKPQADVFIDDRAIRFEGNWNEIMHQLFSKLQPWYKNTNKGDQ